MSRPSGSARPTTGAAERHASIVLALATVAVSFSAIFIRLADDTAATVVWLRMALATVLLAPFAVRNLRRATPPSRDQIILIVLAGVLLGGHFLAWTASLAFTSVAASVLLVSLHPLVVAPAARWLLGERIPWPAAAGAGLALAGTAVTCVGDFRLNSHALTGDYLALIGAGCLAAYLLIGRAVRASVGVAPYSTAVFSVVAVTAVIAAAAGGDVHLPSLRASVACLALAVVCTVGGHTVYNWALKHVRAIGVSVSFLGEPPLAAGLAVLILGNVPTPATVVGGVLILVGLAITLRALPSDPVVAGVAQQLE